MFTVNVSRLHEVRKFTFVSRHSGHKRTLNLQIWLVKQVVVTEVERKGCTGVSFSYLSILTNSQSTRFMELSG
jgi:hypothetical protein